MDWLIQHFVEFGETPERIQNEIDGWKWVFTKLFRFRASYGDPCQGIERNDDEGMVGDSPISHYDSWVYEGGSCSLVAVSGEFGTADSGARILRSLELSTKW